MKSFTIKYTPGSGITQVGDISAHCYRLCDGFFQFYSTEEDKSLEHPFKSINKDYVMYVGESHPQPKDETIA